MTYYSSSEGPDPAAAAPWREYRRWQAARRRRRWTAAALALAIVAAGTAALWPRQLRHDAGDPAGALPGFETPSRGKAVAIGPSTGSAPSDSDRSAMTALMGSSAESAPPLPEEISLVPPHEATAPASAAAPPAPPPAASEAAASPVVETPAPAEPLPPPRPTAKPARDGAGGPALQLASFRTEAKAQSALEQLRGEQKDLLGSVEMHVQRTELRDGRVVFRVQSGALDGLAEARRICSELKRRRLECQFLR
jgi:hypothetical protein